MVMVSSAPPRLATDDVEAGLGAPTTTPVGTLAPSSRRNEEVAGTSTGPHEGIGTASVAAATEAVAVGDDLATSTSLPVGSAGTFVPTITIARAA